MSFGIRVFPNVRVSQARQFPVTLSFISLPSSSLISDTIVLSQIKRVFFQLVCLTHFSAGEELPYLGNSDRVCGSRQTVPQLQFLNLQCFFTRLLLFPSSF